MGSIVKSVFGSKDQQPTSKNPEWLDNASQDVYGMGKDYVKNNPDYNPYTGQRVAGLSDNQQVATQNAYNNVGRFGDQYKQIQGLASDAATPYTQTYNPNSVGARDVGTQDFTEANIGGYMNPYIQSALQPQLDQIQEDSDLQHNQLNSRAAGSGNFGGSRQALLEDLLQRRTDTNKQNVTAQGYNTGFDKASGLFTSDQNRALQADTSNQSKDIDLGKYNEDQSLKSFLSNYGIFKDNADRSLASANSLNDLVKTQRDVTTAVNNDLLKTGALGQTQNQAQLDTDYNDFLASQGYDKDQIGWLSSLLGNNAAKGAYTGNVEDGYKEGDNGVANMIKTGISLFSDIRVKEDIVKVGKKDGVNIYDFKYLDKPGRYRGVMAQEVEHIPGAVMKNKNGIKMVDYSKLPVEFERVGM